MPATTQRKPVHLAPNAGRVYSMGPLRAVFKADGAETAERYALSEWWLEPKTKGPGAHRHDDDDVFYVLQGTVSFRIGTRWIDAEPGAVVIAPGGMLHDFENRSNAPAGFLNISVPGGFEEAMPGIADWFRARSDKDSRTTEPPAKTRVTKKTPPAPKPPRSKKPRTRSL